MAQKFVMNGYTLPTGIMTKGDVTNMQKALGVGVDGVWGPKTQAAYNAYVQQRGEAAKYAYPNLRPPIGITTNAGVAALQGKLGIYSTGMWDQHSQDTLDQTLIRQLPHNKSKLADVEKMTPAEQYEFDMLGYEYGIGRDDRDYAIAGFDVPEWLNSKEKVASYQKMLGVKEDGLWGPRTEKAHQELLADIEWTNARQSAVTTPYITVANSAVKGSSIETKPNTANSGSWHDRFFDWLKGSSGSSGRTEDEILYLEPTPSPTPMPTPTPKPPRLTPTPKPSAAEMERQERALKHYGPGKPDADYMDSEFDAPLAYFENALDYQHLTSKAKNLYNTTLEKFGKDHSAIDLLPGKEENEVDVLRKMWDRPLEEIIARCLIYEFGHADRSDQRVEACHTLINRMLRNFTSDHFSRRAFDSNGNYGEPRGDYADRQLKEMLFGRNQFTTINFLTEYGKEGGSLSDYIGKNKSYRLSKYLGESGSKKGWEEACFMGTILAAMFEELQTPRQMYEQFPAHDPEGWRYLARAYHIAFDEILGGVYTNDEFPQYKYDHFEKYDDSWKYGNFFIY